MKAEIKSISPITLHYDWSEIAIIEDWNHYQWFTLDIGISGDDGSDIFYALVATPAAEYLAKKENPDSHCFVVESFSKQSVIETLTSYVSGLSGASWDDFTEELKKVMKWEYEGMR